MFGDNRNGRCGIGTDELFITIPKYLYTQFKKLFCGHHHSVAIDHHGALYAWGKNRFGQLGKGEDSLADNEQTN